MDLPKNNEPNPWRSSEETVAINFIGWPFSAITATWWNSPANEATKG
jgi:hypothetical protein